MIRYSCQVPIQRHQNYTTVATYSCHWSDPPRSHGHSVVMVVLKGGSTCSRPIVSLTSITTSASRAPCTPPIHPPAISVWPNFRHTRGELTLTMTPKYIGLGQFPSALLISIAGHSFQFIRMNLLALFASFEYRQYINSFPLSILLM